MITQENIPYTADEIKAMVKTIKELRKKYNEALERARDLMTNQNPPAFDKHLIETIFPELASEDDKIRKELIEHIKANKSADYVLFKRFSPDDVIAWLEKQGEKNINHTDIKEKAHQIAWETSKDYDPSLSKEAWCEMAALDMASWLGKKGEQKQTWKPSAAQLIVIKELLEDKNTSKVNKLILRGMFDEFKQFTNSNTETNKL